MNLHHLNEPLSFLLAILSVAIAYFYNFPDPLAGILLPTLAITIAIVPHELAHRQVARGKGCWSRFVLYPPGFFVTFIVNALFGVLTRSPLLFISGYTFISCYRYTSDHEGHISLAGPLTNIIISLASLALLYSLPLDSLEISFLAYLMRLNAFVAFFNLLPLGPLDGSKIFRWNIAIWAILFALSAYLAFVL